MAGRLVKNETKTDGEYILADAIHIIFLYLSIEDLRNAALVNRSWYNRASRERLMRGLWIIPFYASKVYSRRIQTHESCHIFFRQKEERIHVRTDVVKLNDKNVVNEDAVCLAIPEYRDLKMHYTIPWIYDEGTECFERLLPKDCNSKLMMLLFTPKYLQFDLIQNFKQTMKERNQKYAVWGTCLPNDTIRSIYFDNGDFDMGLGIYAMCITGNCLNSFSTVIDCRIKKRKFNQNIRKFQELRLKRDSVGLACGPRWIRAISPDDNLKGTYKSCENMMRFVKRVFPDIPIIGLLNDHNTPKCYGMESTIEDFDQELEHVMTSSFIILTYD